MVEVSINAKQVQLFKSLMANVNYAQAQLNTFAAALFAGQDLDNVQQIMLVEVPDGTAKLVGAVPQA